MGRERSPGNEPPLGNAGARYPDPPGREHIRGDATGFSTAGGQLLG